MGCSPLNKKPLGEIVDMTSGGTPSKNNKAFWYGDVPWISAKEMQEDYISDSALKLTAEGLAAGSRLAPSGSLLLLTRGSGLFNRIPLGIAQRDVAFNQDVKCLQSKIPGITNEYLFFALKGLEHKISNLLETTGIGAGKLSTDRLLSLEIPLFDSSYRAKLSEFAKALFNKIELNSRLNDYLEETITALFEKVYIESNWSSLSTITSRIKEKNGDRSLPVLTATKEGKLVLSDEYFTKRVYSKSISNYVIVPPLTIAYNPSRANIGSLGLNKFGHSGCVSPVYIVVAPEDGYAFYMDALMNTKAFKKAVEARSSGSVRQSLSFDDFQQIELPIPNKDKVARFNRETEGYRVAMNRIAYENKQLVQLRDALLPKLMSGEIDVSQVDLTQLNNHLGEH